MVRHKVWAALEGNSFTAGFPKDLTGLLLVEDICRDWRENHVCILIADDGDGDVAIVDGEGGADIQREDGGDGPEKEAPKKKRRVTGKSTPTDVVNERSKVAEPKRKTAIGSKDHQPKNKKSKADNSDKPKSNTANGKRAKVKVPVPALEAIQSGLGRLSPPPYFKEPVNRTLKFLLSKEMRVPPRPKFLPRHRVIPLHDGSIKFDAPRIRGLHADWRVDCFRRNKDRYCMAVHCRCIRCKTKKLYGCSKW